MGQVVVACDKFKGSLDARDVAASLVAGFRRAAPAVPVTAAPVADGGDGTVAALAEAGWSLVPVTAEGPTGEPVDTAYAVREGRAVVEMASVCGLARLPGGPAPLRASSAGLGQVLARVLDDGYREVVVAVGGSAGSDGGAGMVSALGAVLRDHAGKPLPPGGGSLADVASLDLDRLHPALAGTQFVLASDVSNPLLGPQGAVAVYGPQKGATGDIAQRLEEGLSRWADLVAARIGRDHRSRPGAGAAGGVGFAALSVLGARRQPGIELLLSLIGFGASLDGARLVVTGEGRLDTQTLSGKAPLGVARAAQRAGVPVVAVCGRNDLQPQQAAAAGLRQVFALTDLEPDPAVCMQNARPLLQRLAAEVARAWLL